jgi:hypothetical protein
MLLGDIIKPLKFAMSSHSSTTLPDARNVLQVNGSALTSLLK